MFKNAVYSLLVGTFALVLTVINIMVTVPLFGEEIQTSMYFNAVLGCYGIGSTVTFYLLKQKEQLRQSNIKAEELRRQLEVANAKLAHKLRIDHMTGFLNRETFLTEVGERRACGKGGALLLVDADHFKSINDRFGHASGDVALLKITEAIRPSVRAMDLVGRIGGEEFAVYLPGASQGDIETVAERIRQTVEQIAFLPEGEVENVPLTVSIGGAFMFRDRETAKTLLEADQNLYKAKHDGRNRVVLAASQSQAA